MKTLGVQSGQAVYCSNFKQARSTDPIQSPFSHAAKSATDLSRDTFDPFFSEK